MHAAIDPREIITEEALRVAPDLLGTPLARPWRRLVAILIDLTLAGFLAAVVGEPRLFFAVVAAVAIYRVTRSRQGTGVFLRYLLRAIRFGVALVVFGLAVAFGSVWRIRDVERPRSSDGRIQAEMNLIDTGLTLMDVRALVMAGSEEEARAAAERFRSRLIANGVQPEELARIAQQFHEFDESDSPLSPVALAGVRQVFAQDLAFVPVSSDSIHRPSADSLALAYVAALRARDTATALAIRPELAASLAADTIAALERRNDLLRDEVTSLEERVRSAERRRRGILAFIRQTLDDFGLSLGWLMLYFVAIPVLWNGYTPGKRLLGIRIQRLDGGKLGWWVAIERFSGYSAALVTGLAGFAQIFWDCNRQCIQDKIAMTVVVRERTKRPEEAPVAEEQEDDAETTPPEDTPAELESIA